MNRKYDYCIGLFYCRVIYRICSYVDYSTRVCSATYCSTVVCSIADYSTHPQQIVLMDYVLVCQVAYYSSTDNFIAVYSIAMCSSIFCLDCSIATYSTTMFYLVMLQTIFLQIVVLYFVLNMQRAANKRQLAATKQKKWGLCPDEGGFS